MTRILLAAAVAGLLAAGALVASGETQERTAVAYFDQVKGLYEGDNVMILGVKVGTVTRIEPEPGRVRVELTYDAEQPVPADAKAIITAPSLVPVRNVTLAPVYRGGAQLTDGATIPLSRTAIPVEWDEIKQQLSELTTALGPRGANRDGALNRLLDTGARTLKGQGASMNETVHALSEAMSTLADNRGKVFGTVRNLQVFISALKRSDAQVVEFNGRLTDVADLLDDHSGEFGDAIDGLNRAFGKVQKFLKANRSALTGTLKQLRPLAATLADNRQHLADVLHAAPTALSNLYGIYDPIDGSLATSAASANMQAPAVLVCSALMDLGGTKDDCYDALGPLAEVAAAPPPNFGTSPLERNGRCNQVRARPGPEPEPDECPRKDLAGLMTGGGS